MLHRSNQFSGIVINSITKFEWKSKLACYRIGIITHVGYLGFQLCLLPQITFVGIFHMLSKHEYFCLSEELLLQIAFLPHCQGELIYERPSYHLVKEKSEFNPLFLLVFLFSKTNALKSKKIFERIVGSCGCKISNSFIPSISSFSFSSLARIFSGKRWKINEHLSLKRRKISGIFQSKLQTRKGLRKKRKNA